MRTDIAPTTTAPSTRRPAGWRYHFHLPGLVYLAVTMILVLGAVNGQNNLLFWLFGLAVAGMVLSGFLSAAALSGVRIDRTLPPRASVGEECSVQYTVSNRSWVSPSLGLLIEELFDKTPPQIGGLIHAAAPIVRRKSVVTAVARFRPTARGVLKLNRCRALTTFPFGLMKKSVLFQLPDRLVVWPAVTQIDSGLFARITTSGREGRENRMKAAEGDFFALREYIPGDSTRLIAWRSTARLGHTVIRESASPRTRRAWIIIAADGASHLAVEGAVSLAAGAAERLLAMGFEVGLLAPDSTVVVPTGRSKRHLNAMLDALAVYDPKGETPPVSAEPHTAAERDLRIVVAAQGAAAATAGDLRLVAEPAPSPPMQLAGEAESPLRWLRRALTGPSRSAGGER